MFSCDVPLSKTFGFRGYSVFHERFRRVLVAHSGYNELTNPDQTLVLGSGAPKAIALCSVKAEQCHGGMEQLQFLMGDRAGHQTDRSEICLFTNNMAQLARTLPGFFGRNNLSPTFSRINVTQNYVTCLPYYENLCSKTGKKILQVGT